MQLNNIHTHEMWEGVLIWELNFGIITQGQIGPYEGVIKCYNEFQGPEEYFVLLNFFNEDFVTKIPTKRISYNKVFILVY